MTNTALVGASSSTVVPSCGALCEGPKSWRGPFPPLRSAGGMWSPAGDSLPLPPVPSRPYFLPHQSNMPPMRPPVSNAFFWFASKLS
jgi:hypothetical protein